jgi:hypothetical protein
VFHRACRPLDDPVFAAGIGNRETDAVAYQVLTWWTVGLVRYTSCAVAMLSRAAGKRLHKDITGRAVPPRLLPAPLTVNVRLVLANAATPVAQRCHFSEVTQGRQYIKSLLRTEPPT